MPRTTIVKTIRLKPALWADLELAAAAAEISPNGMIIRLLERLGGAPAEPRADPEKRGRKRSKGKR